MKTLQMGMLGVPDGAQPNGPRHGPARNGIYASTPGTGPAGKTCRTCEHKIYSHHSLPKHPKCNLVAWTAGDATTIKTSTPACRRYEERRP